MNRPVLLSTVALAALLPLGAQAQNSESAPSRSSDTRKISKKPTSFSAKVGDSGKVLTADKDSKIWMVSNPEALSGIDGSHVKVKREWTWRKAKFEFSPLAQLRMNKQAQGFMTPPSGGDAIR